MSNPKKKSKTDYAKRMDRVLEYIHTHLDEPLELSVLAEVACFSLYHFHRIFSGMVGESVKSYVRRLRLERAAISLMHSKAPVTEIAFNAGFETHESFTRAFNSRFGISPQGFRKVHRVNLEKKQIEYWKEIIMEAHIVELEDMDVYFVRHVGPYAECASAWETLCGWAGPKGLIRPEVRFLSLNHDDPDVTAPEKIRCDVCMTVEAPTPAPQPPISRKTIEGGRYAMTVHHGPYEKLAETYAQLCGQWAPQNGYEIEAQASIEIYLNSPKQTAPEDLITQVHIPIK
ncbi:AraC family transcriptional regulator [Pseudodesulfovibrio sediminis]|nr:AraC family transcriptional regulator [Pseudodesulfovibrio sediminis]